jgi:hypothetical protein
MVNKISMKHPISEVKGQAMSQMIFKLTQGCLSFEVLQNAQQNPLIPFIPYARPGGSFL